MSEPTDQRSITPLQLARIDELEKKAKVTVNQAKELVLLKQKRDAPPALSDTCILYLLEMYAWERFGKKRVSEEPAILYAEKGKLVEDESIKLLSLIDGVKYKKNVETISNDFLCGLYDVLTPNKHKVIDIKSKWDFIAFLSVFQKPIPLIHSWQIKGYMELTGASEGEIAHCLINTPESIKQEQLDRLFTKMCGKSSYATPEYHLVADQLINNMIFDNIPAEQRVYKTQVEKCPDMQKVSDRVKMCRKWLSDFDESYMKLNKK